MKIKIAKIKAENGSIKHKIMMTGIAPKNGPNTGITFVTQLSMGEGNCLHSFYLSTIR